MKTTIRSLTTCLLVLLTLGSFAQSWNEILQAYPQNTIATQYFGFSVDMSGDYAVIGAPSEGTGTVYVYKRNASGDWIEEDRLQITDVHPSPAHDPMFGHDVAVSSTGQVFVGAPHYESFSNFAHLIETGGVLVFEESTPGTWTNSLILTQDLGGGSREQYSHYGTSVSVSGDMLIIGCPRADLDAAGANSLNGAGIVDVYRDLTLAGGWSFRQRLDAPDRYYDDHFGFSADIDGDHLVVGAPAHDKNDAGVNHAVTDAGAAYFYRETSLDTWTFVQKIANPNPTLSAENQGFSVSIDGTIVAVGAPGKELDASGANPSSSSGLVSIYEYNSGANSWSTSNFYINDAHRNNFESFGYSVFVDGNYLAVGAPGDYLDSNGMNSASESGTVEIFERIGVQNWTRVQILSASDRVSLARFGSAVAMNSSASQMPLLIGSSGKPPTGSGSAYFLRNCTNSTATISEAGCTSYTVPSGDETYTASGTYMDTIPNSAGCDSILTINLTIGDTTPPVFTGCPTNIVGYSLTTQCGGSAIWTPPGVTDNCGTTNVISTHAPGDTFPIGTTTVTYTADDGGTVVTPNQEVYLYDNGSSDLHRFNYDGSNSATNNFASTTVVSVAFDRTNAHLYRLTGSDIIRTDVDGSNPSTIVSGISAGQEIEIDVAQGYIFWSEYTGRQVRRANLDGSNIIVIHSTAPSGNRNFGIGLDKVNQKIYWVDHTPSSIASLFVANYDGTGVSTIGSTIFGVTDVAPAPSLNRLYWTVNSSAGSGSIGYRDLGTTTDQTVHSGTNALTFILDDTDSQIIWYDQVTDEIVSSAIAGGAISTLVSGITSMVFVGKGDGTAVAGSSPNVATCSFTVTISDSTAPTFSNCPTDITVYGPISNCQTQATWTPPTATDNCATNVTMTSSHTPGDQFALGTTQVTYTAMDSLINGSNNSSTCTFNVTVLDTANHDSTQSLAICPGGSVMVGTNTYNSAGTYMDTIAAANGCDSVITTNLSILTPDTTTQVLNECAGFTVTVGTNTYSTTGTYTDTLTNMSGCDSIVITDLTINTLIDQTVTPDAIGICPNTSTTVTVASTENGVSYALVDGSGTVVDGPTLGTGGAINFATPLLSAPENFTVSATSGGTNALNFTGPQTYFDPNDNPSFTNSFTYEMWVNPTGVRVNEVESNGGSSAGTSGQKWALHPTHRGSNGGFGISIGNNGIGVYEHGSGFLPCLLSWSGSISGWTHIAIVVQNKQPRLYVNGTLVHTGLTSVRPNLVPSLGNGGTFGGQFGGIGAGVFGFYEGDISEVRLWSDVRTDTEIANNMSSCLAGNEAGLYAWYPFIDGTGATSITDVGPNNLHGAFNQLDGNDWITNATNSCTAPTCTLVLSDTVNVTINPPTTFTQTLVECQGFSVTVGTNTYNTTGVYTDVLVNANGCDSTVTTDLTINMPTTFTQTLVECQGFSITVGTNTYTTIGVYTDVLVNANGCDSTVTTDLTINQPTTFTQTFVECQGFSVTVGTNTYNTTGVYTDVLVNANGCDSTVTTDLTINMPSALTQTFVECQGFSVTVGTNTYNTTGVYTDVLVNANGCDSTVTTDLTINMPTTFTQTLVECQGFSITVGTSTYTTTGVYTDVLVNANGCDSTVTTDLTINMPTAFTQTFVECQGFSVTVGSNTYTTTGVYMDTLTNAVGCDSVVTTDLTINLPTAFTQTLAGCPGYSVTVGSNTYTTTGVYMDTLTNAVGCDSVVTTDLTINLPTAFTQTLAGCPGYSVTVGSNTYTSTGVYIDTLTNSSGCDSIVTTDLTVASQILITQTFDECFGFSVMVGSNTYNTTGVYVDTMISGAGCDSIVTTDLTVNPEITITQTLVECFGFSVSVGNSTYSSTGVYVDTLISATGCDSIVTTDLTVNPQITTTQTLVECTGFEVTVGNNTYDSTGVYIDTLISVAGCDSIVTTDLTVNDIATGVTSSGFTLTSAHPGADYQWLDCNNGMAPISGETGQSFTATANGDYAVEVSWNGCRDTSACINITGIGISDRNANEITVSMYPNPTRGITQLVFDQPTNAATITVSDISGKLIQQFAIRQSTRATIDLTEVAPGYYYVRIEHTQGTKIMQVVKQ